MSESVHTNTSLWSKGMKAVIVAQFLSAFGDNALLFATLALLKAQFYPCLLYTSPSPRDCS